MALLIIVPMIVGSFSGGQGGWGGWGGMMGPGMMGFGAFGGLMMIPMVLFWGLIIWLIVWLVRGAGGGCGGSWRYDRHDESNSALDILKTRYARGEINKEEFEAKKKDLV